MYPSKRLKPYGKEHREKVRLRVQAFRERQKEAAELEESKRADYEELLKYQREQNLIWIGEVSPGENCQTAQQELEIASLFAAAMSIEPIKTGESIRVFLNRVIRRCCEIGTPLLSLATKTFAEPVKPPDAERLDSLIDFANAYEFPGGCDVVPNAIPVLGEATNG